MTSYLPSSSSRTNRGARTSCDLAGYKFIETVFIESFSRIAGRLGKPGDGQIAMFTGVLHDTCVDFRFSFALKCLGLVGCGGLPTQNGMFFAAGDSAICGGLKGVESGSGLWESSSRTSGLGAMPPRITAAVCWTTSGLSRKRLASLRQSWM
jgi:hypothetical protein